MVRFIIMKASTLIILHKRYYGVSTGHNRKQRSRTVSDRTMDKNQSRPTVPDIVGQHGTDQENVSVAKVIVAMQYGGMDYP
jgi:hypothetical protein